MKLFISSPAVRMGLSISVATGLYGLSFGALSVAAGLSYWQTVALSLLMYTGGSQFAFVGVIAGGGAPASAVGAATLLGVRNALYGMQLNALLRPRAVLRPLAAQLTIDESTATATAQETPEERQRGFWTAAIGVFVVWNLCTMLGAWAGNSLGDPRQFGLDGAAVAAFLALLWPRLRQRQAVALAVASALVTVVAVPWLPPGLPILLAAVVAIGWSQWQRRTG